MQAAMAESGDDAYLAYTRFVHGDRTKALGVSAGRVYLTKHRISALVKKELKRLESTSALADGARG